MLTPQQGTSLRTSARQTMSSSASPTSPAPTSPLPSPPPPAFINFAHHDNANRPPVQISIHLAEMAPPAFRATFPVVAYQLGNMVFSASAQIEAAGGEKTTIRLRKGAGVAVFVLVITVIKPENHGSHFEKHRAAFHQGGGADDAWIDDEGVHHADWARGAGPRY
ncbi:hypothetical protein C8R46DRAFT_1343794 [Mycena filopes]|nr:hypothetical protein C8R46DRAFT_1343794 [Mycena filopes]